MSDTFWPNNRYFLCIVGGGGLTPLIILFIHFIQIYTLII